MRKHSIYSTLAIFLIFITISSSTLFPQAVNTKENRDYKYAAGLYAEGMYDMAIRELEKFEDTCPKSKYIVYARFLLAGSHFYQQKFKKTIQITGRIRKENPSTDIMDKVLFLEGRAQFQLNQYKEAISILERLLKQYPESSHIAEAMYNVGDASFNLKNYQKAAATYQTLAEKYQESDVADWAWYSQLYR